MHWPLAIQQREYVKRMNWKRFRLVGFGSLEETMHRMSQKELDHHYTRRADMMDRHRELELQMRPLLLEWMIDVFFTTKISINLKLIKWNLVWYWILDSF